MNDIWLNGERGAPVTQGGLDRGLLYGDGFFTTMLVVQGQLANWSGHVSRLEQSARRLGFEGFDLAACRQDLAQVMQTWGSWPDFAVIKLIVTRGTGGKGYQPAVHQDHRRYIQVLPYPKGEKMQSLPECASPAWQIFMPSVTESSVTWGKQPLLAGLKHLNRLENVLARQALMDTPWEEALMMDMDGHYISATQANLCIVEGKQLLTPDLNDCGVQGTALSSLADICRSRGLTLKTTRFNRQRLQQAEEVFLCNALRGVMPVSQFDQRTFRTEVGRQLAEDWINWTMAHLTPLNALENG
ncbi:MAG: aminodeoxychorismate lyase [Hydrogenovibrio sp.]|nr:aminodeoxychorismate lyase [Hydrogenovibrio sp.]